MSNPVDLKQTPFGVRVFRIGPKGTPADLGAVIVDRNTIQPGITDIQARDIVRLRLRNGNHLLPAGDKMSAGLSALNALFGTNLQKGVQSSKGKRDPTRTKAAFKRMFGVDDDDTATESSVTASDYATQDVDELAMDALLSPEPAPSRRRANSRASSVASNSDGDDDSFHDTQEADMDALLKREEDARSQRQAEEKESQLKAEKAHRQLAADEIRQFQKAKAEREELERQAAEKDREWREQERQRKEQELEEKAQREVEERRRQEQKAKSSWGDALKGAIGLKRAPEPSNADAAWKTTVDDVNMKLEEARKARDAAEANERQAARKLREKDAELDDMARRLKERDEAFQKLVEQMQQLTLAVSTKPHVVLPSTRAMTGVELLALVMCF